MSGILIDTNVLVYAHDPVDVRKQIQAIEVLDTLHQRDRGYLSTQVLAEFFAAATRGSSPLLSLPRAAKQMDNLVQSWRVLDLTPWIVTEAVRGVRAHQFSYWDAQIWATARASQIPVVFSEDFNSRSTVEGVRFASPFDDDFDIAFWLER